jgi:hypothetical protein
MSKIEKFDAAVVAAVRELFEDRSAEPVKFTEIIGMLEAHKLGIFDMMRAARLQKQMEENRKNHPLILAPPGRPPGPR